MSRGGARKVPGTPDDFLKLPGGVPDLSKLGKLPAKTYHQTTFQHSMIGLELLIDEEGRVSGYQIKIHDQVENHTYLFSMDAELHQTMLRMFDQAPPIGTKLDAEGNIVNG